MDKITFLNGHVKIYGKEYRIPLLVSVIFATLGSITSIVSPRLLREVTDLISEGIATSIDLGAIGKLCGILVILYVMGTLLTFLQGYLVTNVTQGFSKKLREQISNKINQLPLKYFDTHSQGDTLSRVTNDIDLVGQSLLQSLGVLVPASTLFVGCILLMLCTNLILSGTAILSALFGFVIMGFIMSHSQGHFNAQQEKLSKINGFIEEAYSGYNVITSYNATKKAGEEFDHINDSLQSTVRMAVFLSGIMQPLMNFVENFSYVTVSVIGAILAMQGQITLGVIVEFMVYARLFSQPLGQLAQAATSLQSAVASMTRVFEFLDEEEMNNETEKEGSPGIAKGEVVFNQVSFGYDPRKIIIHEFSATAKTGNKIAIVGPTGAGKTTMVNLLMKFYEINDGEIKIDGVSLSDMSREEVHDKFCMVLQDTWLFSGTVRENLVFNKVRVTEEQVKSACKAVGADRFIRALPNGYDTVLDDNTALSVGQKQLLTIARALIKDSPMLILDEATSSVDTRTEEQIQIAMDKLMEGRTSFVIAHRLSTIRNADLILVMKDGNIIEKGNHEELLLQNGFYADLYNSQFAK